MKHAIRAVVAATALAAAAVSAQAATTTLNFTLPFLEQTLEYGNTVGGDLTVSANGGKLVSFAGELGVAKRWLFADYRINSGESITFSFEKTVNLLSWDLDDFFLSTNKFSLSVDGASPLTLSTFSHSNSPILSGKTFTFGYKGDAYFIDTLKFGSVTPVPEASSVAMTLAGLGVVGFIAARRRRA